MPQNRLILRQTASPFVFPLADIVKGSVLSWDEVDGNFIFLKGLNVQSGSVVGSDIVFNRINGDTFSVDVSSLTGGTPTTDVFVTGGTYNSITGDATFVNNTGGTFTVTGFTSGISSGGYVNNIIPSGTTITVPQNQQYIVYGDLDILSGGTLDNLGDVVIINGTLNNSGSYNNSGTTTFVSFPTGDTYVTGFTFNPANYDISLTRNDNVTLTQNLSILASDLTVTGGTYNPANGEGTFTNNTGGTFVVTGFLTGYTDFYTTGATLNSNTIEFNRTDSSNAYSIDLSPILTGISGFDVFVTGGTYTSSASTISFINNTGGTFSVTGVTDPVVVQGVGVQDTVRKGLGNAASGSFATVSGGGSNTASGFTATVGGGQSNIALGLGSTVSGGLFNTTRGFSTATVLEPNFSVIGGGNSNTATGSTNTIAGGAINNILGSLNSVGGGSNNNITSSGSTIGGGISNTASGACSIVSGGFCNTASSTGSTVSGGLCNTVSGCLSTVGGGQGNIVSGAASTVSGGYCNSASGPVSTVGGGVINTASCNAATVGGGQSNTASGCRSTVGGGVCNTASGGISTIGGGRSNTVAGSCSTVSGGYCNTIAAYSGLVSGLNITSNTLSGIPTSSANYITITSTSGGGSGISFFIFFGTGTTIVSTTIGLGGQNYSVSDTITVDYTDIPSGGVTGGSVTFTVTQVVSGLNSVSGGICNSISGVTGFIGGGECNIVGDRGSVVSGGILNTSTGVTSTVGGGSNNTSSGLATVVGGGVGNIANNFFGTVSGGYNNTSSCGGSTVGGGQGNDALGSCSTVSGGQSNTASGNNSTVSGGLCNAALGCLSTIGGGFCNTISSGSTASGILGGSLNSITGDTCTFIIGSNITADRTCATFVNNLSIMGLPNGAGSLPSGSLYYCSTDCNRVYYVP